MKTRKLSAAEKEKINSSLPLLKNNKEQADSQIDTSANESVGDDPGNVVGDDPGNVKKDIIEEGEVKKRFDFSYSKQH